MPWEKYQIMLKKNTTISYIDLKNSLRNEPESVALFNDSQLFYMYDGGLPRGLDIEARFFAEVFIRTILYKEPDCCLFINLKNLILHKFPHIKDILSPKGNSITETASIRNSEYTHLSDLENLIITIVKVRAQIFLNADGIIPVVNQDEAFPLPFKLNRLESAKGGIRDTSGEIIGKWTKDFLDMDAFFELKDTRVTVQCIAGNFRDLFEGASFGLPVLLAFSRWRGKMGDFSPLEVLATGVICRGHLKAVYDIDAKLRLATKMGVKLFIAPNIVKNSNCLSLEAGVTASECINVINNVFEIRKHSRLTPEIALIHIRNLKEEIHSGNVHFEECEDRLKLYENIFHCNISSDKYYSPEGIVLVNLVKGAMSNHCGNPSEGKRYNRKAARLARRHNKNLLYIRASSSAIVSLTDLCEFDEAEIEAENLLRNILRHPPENHEDRIRGERNAFGAIGAQVYLQKALIDPASEYKAKSKAFIEKSYELSKMLYKEESDRKDICRNAIQTFLWSTLLEPDNTEIKYGEVLAVLQDYPAENKVGFGYFTNHRFLGAYRLLLTKNKITPGFDKWDLPSDEVGADSWVRGLALKYRAALYAASGNFNNAIHNFEAALKTFEKLDNPLLRFFSGPLCLQAGDSLMEYNRKISDNYLRKAKTIFTTFNGWFLQTKELSIKQWLMRADGFLNSKSKDKLPNPQIKYRY